MISFDPSQQRALALDPGRHARVLGAPGTGKTRTLVAAFAGALERPGWGEEDVLAIAPSRLVAAQLRAAIERGVGRAFGGTPVRTPASLGFSVLARAAALAGRPAPRLLTGTAHDEAIAAVLEAGGGAVAGLTDEVVRSAPFRAELRELWRIVDDFAEDPATLAARLGEAAARAAAEAHTRAPDPELAARWADGLALVAAVASRLEAERPGEISSSGILRAAARAVREGGAAGDGVLAAGPDAPRLRLPRLILVDDAQELSEGDLALLAACAAVGSRVWAFGDPDTATGAFHGERTAVLSRLDTELVRRGGPAAGDGAAEPLVVLGTAHRHSAELRGFVVDLTRRVGAAGAGEQRAAGPRPGPVGPAGPEDGGAATPDAAPAAVQFARAGSAAEQLGMIAHRLRARHLGLDGAEPVPWDEMAIFCRSRGEAARVARSLAAHQVPTGVAAGGVVLREHQIVRELVRLLQHALGIHPLGPDEVLQLAGGVIGGLDPVAVRRLRGALLLQERREARAEGRAPEGVDALVADAFAHPGARPVVDSAGGRALRRLGRIAAEAVAVRAAGGTARETLWALWSGAGLAARWQADALESRGARADEAHRSLDAVMGLFFALQRHEEQDSEQPVDALLEELLESALPEDSLARRSERSAVTVTTPQGAVGREFRLVAVVGLQDGAWPNLRARGSMLGTAALERWLRGGAAEPPSRRDTLHDELRLLVHSCSRAAEELLVVAIADEDEHPSPFFALGARHLVAGLPSSRLTLRGATAGMRRRLTLDPDDRTALDSLAALARAGAPGAAPDEWYGVLPPSTDAPLTDLAGDPEAVVAVSPSQLERVEECPLDWVISALGGGTGSAQASLGTLVHHALEIAEGPDPEPMLEAVMREWGKLPFDADWESERARRTAESMVRGLAAYLREFEGSDRRLVGSEARFRLPIGRAVLSGIADRLELRERADGGVEVTVLDLKTGRTPPTAAETQRHAQLQAYQLGVAEGAFVAPRDGGADGGPGGAADGAGTDAPAGSGSALPEGAVSGGARLLYVHPDAAKRSPFVEKAQEPLDAEARAAFADRVLAAAEVMASERFEARVEHHCSDPHAHGLCSLHIVPAVSRA